MVQAQKLTQTGRRSVLARKTAKVVKPAEAADGGGRIRGIDRAFELPCVVEGARLGKRRWFVGPCRRPGAQQDQRNDDDNGGTHSRIVAHSPTI